MKGNFIYWIHLVRKLRGWRTKCLTQVVILKIDTSAAFYKSKYKTVFQSVPLPSSNLFSLCSLLTKHFSNYRKNVKVSSSWLSSIQLAYNCSYNLCSWSPLDARCIFKWDIISVAWGYCDVGIFFDLQAFCRVVEQHYNPQST